MAKTTSALFLPCTDGLPDIPPPLGRWKDDPLPDQERHLAAVVDYLRTHDGQAHLHELIDALGKDAALIGLHAGYSRPLPNIKSAFVLSTGPYVGVPYKLHPAMMRGDDAADAGDEADETVEAGAEAQSGGAS